MMSFTPAADAVAFSTDPAECDRLLAAGSYALVQVRYVGSGTAYGSKAAGFIPTIADPLFLPEVWGMWEPARGMTLKYGGFQALPLGPPPTLFLHARRAPGARERLVHVAALLHYDHMTLPKAREHVRGDWARYEKQQRSDGSADLTFIRLSLTPRVFRPASWFPGSRWTRLKPAATLPANNGVIALPCRVYPSMFDGLKLESTPVRIRTGVPDSTDETRFTLKYDVDGAAGVIEGRLNADDTVTWTIPGGPLKPWPSREHLWGFMP